MVSARWFIAVVIAMSPFRLDDARWGLGLHHDKASGISLVRSQPAIQSINPQAPQGKPGNPSPDPASQEWVVKLHPGMNPLAFATQSGARFKRRIRGLPGYAVFSFPNIAGYSSPEEVGKWLSLLDGIEWFAHQKPKVRVRYSGDPATMPNDPSLPQQWHLGNQDSQTDNNPFPVDLNVASVWRLGYTGKSIQVAVVDDGLDHTHPDLNPNFDAELSFDIREGDSDPYPGHSSLYHGTAIAGVIAARDNGAYGVGVAPRASLVGLRLLDGTATKDYMEAEAMLHNLQDISIYSNSWGPASTDKYVYDGPGKLTKEALEKGSEEGRGGLGNIYVWSAGNGGGKGYNSNFNGYTNLPWTIAVGAVRKNGQAPAYSEPGANVLVCAPGEKILTTDIMGQGGGSRTDMLSTFGGTSAAAPMVAGIVALMLEANPGLTWRDVQAILARTARKVDPGHPDWQVNGAGLPVNHQYGFGLVDADEAVNLAKSWDNLPPTKKEARVTDVFHSLEKDPDSMMESRANIPWEGTVEHVQVTLELQSYDWGELNITLTSPSGTESILATPFQEGEGPEGDPLFNTHIKGWTYMTLRNWGEGAKGEWKLNIRNAHPGHRGQVNKWKLALHVRKSGDALAPLEPKGETLHYDQTINGSHSINVLHNDQGHPDWELLDITRPDGAFTTFSADGTITFAPYGSHHRPATVEYTVIDGEGRTGKALLQIQPYRSSQATSPEYTSHGNPFTIDGPEGTVDWVVTQHPEFGSLQVVEGQRLQYRPEPSKYYSTTFKALATTDYENYTTVGQTITHSPTGSYSRYLDAGASILLVPEGQENRLAITFTLEGHIFPEERGGFIDNPIFSKGSFRLSVRRSSSYSGIVVFNPGGDTPRRYNSNCLTLELTTAEGKRYLSTPQDSIQFEAWQHIALDIYTHGNARIHIDGAQQALFLGNSSAPLAPMLDDADSPLTVGGLWVTQIPPGPEGLYWTTPYQEAHNIALSGLAYCSLQRPSAQIAHSRTFPPRGNEPGLVAYWPLGLTKPTQGNLPNSYVDAPVMKTRFHAPFQWEETHLPEARRIAPFWWQSPSLGLLYTRHAPWIWTGHHQYLYLSIPPGKSNGLWMYGNDLGWIWTKEEFYPRLWSHTLQGWLMYKAPTKDPKEFYDYSTGGMDNWEKPT